jgi:hypothetical protein
MCPPAAIAIGATLISAAAGAAGSFIQAKNATKVANLNANALEQQAALRQEKAKFDAAQAATKFERLRGQQYALIGKSGLDTGTFSDLLADSALESALEQKQIHWTADRESDNLNFQAGSARMNGQMERQGAILSGIGKLAGGAGSIAGQMPSSSVSVSSPWQTSVSYGS